MTEGDSWLLLFFAFVYVIFVWTTEARLGRIEKRLRRVDGQEP
jgi:hypothetical protein